MFCLSSRYKKIYKYITIGIYIIESLKIRNNEDTFVGGQGSPPPKETLYLAFESILIDGSILICGSSAGHHRYSDDTSEGKLDEPIKDLCNSFTIS